MASVRQFRIGIWFGAAGSSSPGRLYRVAEAEVRSSQPIAELAAFETGGQLEAEVGQPELPITNTALLPEIYSDRGLIGGRDVRVTCRGDGQHFRLDIDQGHEVSVWKSAGGFELRTPLDAGNEVARAGILGPGLALALALGGRFCLHASAISVGDRCFLILGESGAGKSTLAAAAAARPGAERVADDVVPTVVIPEGRLVALPRFPQPKLEPTDQWPGRRRFPVDAILFLRRGRGVLEPQWIGLSAREAVLRLVENTVASRLFGADLRVAHLDACVRAATATRVADLAIPDELERLPEIIEFLESAAESETMRLREGLREGEPG